MDPRARRRLLLRAALLLALVGGLAAWGSFARGRRLEQNRFYLDKPLGAAPVDGVEERGFYNTEKSGAAGERFRWTNGAARLAVPASDRRPAALFVRLGVTVPRSPRIQVAVNGVTLADESAPTKGDWVRTLPLDGVPDASEYAVDIVSDTFTPGDGKDARKLGVRVWEVTLLSAEKSYLNAPLGVRAVPGVDETGFHNPETSDGKPCRWTNGAATVRVPLAAADRPTAVAVTALIPDKPDWRVSVVANGATLFEGVLPPRAMWSRELPLDGVALGRELKLELRSPVTVPSKGKAGGTDHRELGVRLYRLEVLGAAEAK